MLSGLLRVYSTTLGPEERSLLRRVSTRMAEVIQTLTEQAKPAYSSAMRDRGIAQAREVVRAALEELQDPIAAGQSVMADGVGSGFAASIDKAFDMRMRGLSAEQLAVASDGPYFGWRTSEWITWHDTKSAALLDRTMRASFFAGEGAEQLARRLADVAGSTKQDMMVTARTALVSAGNDAAQVLYRNNADVIQRVMVIGTLDSDTCRQCGALDGNTYAVDNTAALPTYHPQCRCFIAPLVNGHQPKRVVWSKWIAKQSAETQNKAMGTGAAELMRSGKIQPSQLVTNTGRMRTVAELREVAAQDKPATK